MVIKSVQQSQTKHDDVDVARKELRFCILLQESEQYLMICSNVA